MLLSDVPAFNMFMHFEMCNKRSICSLLRLAVFSANGRERMVWVDPPKLKARSRDEISTAYEMRSRLALSFLDCSAISVQKSRDLQ